eukprot:CAMPEP_0184645712 /NCGR_PEP_ID=MMETSP0308-20130426/2270_1 /TAXON_ID=38269 /ORGANISM="Gloeochaete witrockiana, Strain SAG 46.84" /LENGTH=300 /DNA_ID=CAMNT_0027075017 /DNA_START=1614 /DNA_END=2516 /DNA_ORIENTATION=-
MKNIHYRHVLLLKISFVWVYFFYAQAYERISVPSNNSWALLLCTSRYWFNYRHTANALAVHSILRRLGFPEDRIILMLADNIACNSRNSFCGEVYGNDSHKNNLHPADIHVDYSGLDVNVENVVQVLAGEHASFVPPSKQLRSGPDSRVLVYMTGHGGNGFLKFHDKYELHSRKLAEAFHLMHVRQRYKEILFIADTCQAGTLAKHLHSPNILFVASSSEGESSYSHLTDAKMGVSLMERFTFYLNDFFHSINSSSSVTLKDMLSYLTPERLGSHIDVRTDLFPRALSNVTLVEFFASSS